MLKRFRSIFSISTIVRRFCKIGKGDSLKPWSGHFPMICKKSVWGFHKRASCTMFRHFTLSKKAAKDLTEILHRILGYYCNDTAISDLSSFECPEHKFCDGIYSPQDCPPTFYCPQGSSEGIPCPPGFFCLGGTNGKTSCSKGNFCPGGEDSERPCPPGYKCEVVEMYLPEPCQPGTYQPGTGQENCLNCPDNKFCPTATISDALHDLPDCQGDQTLKIFD